MTFSHNHFCHSLLFKTVFNISMFLSLKWHSVYLKRHLSATLPKYAQHDFYAQRLAILWEGFPGYR